MTITQCSITANPVLELMNILDSKITRKEVNSIKVVLKRVLNHLKFGILAILNSFSVFHVRVSYAVILCHQNKQLHFTLLSRFVKFRGGLGSA